MSNDLFTLLSVGLEVWEERGYRYPYPDPLQQGMNMLAAEMLSGYPSDLDALFTMFGRPLQEWWHWALPEGIDGRFGLLDMYQRVDEQVLDFLCEENLDYLGSGSLAEIAVRRDNNLIRTLVEETREEYVRNPEHAENEYRAVRRFIIEHPFTTPEEIGDYFFDSVHRDLVQEMYERGHLLEHDRTNRGKYWLCPVCGPLRFRNGERASLKPALCQRRCPGPASWQSLTPSARLMVLKRGVQLRTMIPGVVELQAYGWLEQLHQQSEQLVTLQLWPGIDAYDFRLVFSDGTSWAVDVKDVHSPRWLGRKLSEHRGLRSIEERLRWDRFIYVIPDYHEQQHPGYLATAKQLAELPSNTSLVGEADFRYQVEHMLWRLG